MDREHQVCPSCGQPVAAVVRRHKTLGAFVPVWRPGPCQNPRCPRYAGREHPEQSRDKRGRA
ncbi:hypothetical protein ABZ845_06095 [Streptomyces sp. NPDC047022]|uniref:hypothetical protein n=1 Tax=Streptomyces sp. NPDC047022 TaxID=3155737 RepID=UPI00340956B9